MKCNFKLNSYIGFILIFRAKMLFLGLRLDIGILTLHNTLAKS